MFRDTKRKGVVVVAATEQVTDHPILGSQGELSRRQVQSRIWNLAYPAIIEQLLVTLVSMADMIMVGSLGASAIAAIGISNQPIFTANAIFSAVSIGSTALIARLMGAQDYELANKAARQSLILAISSSLVLMVGVFVFAPAMIHFMHAAPDVAPLAITYSRIMGVSLVFSLTSMILNGVLRGAGDMRTPMRVNVVANIINIVFNYLLIFGIGPFPQLGVAGAAISTLLAHIVAFCLVLSVFFSGKFVLTFKRGQSYRPDWEIIKRILNVGLPASVEQLIMRVGMMFYARTVSSLGTTAYAAHQIAINSEGITFTPGMGFSMASTTLVGQSLGAKMPERAKRFGVESRHLAMLTMGTLGLLLFFFPTQIIGFYTDDPAVIEQGVICLRIIALVQPVMGATFVMMGSLRGAGDTRFVMLVTMLGIWIGRLGTAYLLVKGLDMGLAGAWIAMAVDHIIRGSISSLRFHQGGWQKARV